MSSSIPPRLRAVRALVGAGLLLVPLAVASQGAGAPPPLALSIEDALRRAEQGSEAIAISRAGLSRAEAQQLQAWSEWLPQIGASASYERTLASEFEQAFEDLGEQPGGDTGGADGGTAAPSFFSELPFGQANTWRFGLTASQSLFAGGRTVARGKLAKAVVEAQEIQVDSTRAQVVLQTAEAYFDALLTDRLFSIAEATMKQAQETFEQARVGRQVGAKPEFELLRAQVAYENQRPVVVQRRVERDLAYLRLKQLLDLPADRALELTSALGEAELSPIAPLATQIAGTPPPEAGTPRAPVRQAASAVRAQEAAVSIARSQHWPALTLYSNYGRVGYPEGLFPDWQGLRTNWTVGVALQLQLFSGFRVTGDVRAAQADLAEATARLRQMEELGRLEADAARMQLVAAEATWSASAGTVEQAQRANEIALIRYREGVSTQLELSDARLLLQQAQANRARAARDVQVARIRVALLSALPLGEAGGGAAALQQGFAPAVLPTAAPPPSTSAPAGAAEAGAGGGAATGF